MKWLFIIDPLEKLNPATDTTYPIMREAAARGVSVLFSTIGRLFFHEKVRANASALTFSDKGHTVGEQTPVDLDDLDLIFMRKEPPYDLAFHYATQLLSLTRTRVVNSPQALRDLNEKLIALHFHDLMPETIVANDEHVIRQFRGIHQPVIVKHLDSYQGKAVQKLTAADTLTPGPEPVMLQEYLPGIARGDKRVLVLGSRVLGVLKRVPKQGSFIANLGQGATPEKAELTAKDHAVLEKVIPFLNQHDILFAGIDLIDGRLIEINITCPTGLQHINRLEHKQLEKDVVDYFLTLANLG